MVTAKRLGALRAGELPPSHPVVYSPVPTMSTFGSAAALEDADACDIMNVEVRDTH